MLLLQMPAVRSAAACLMLVLMTLSAETWAEDAEAASKRPLVVAHRGLLLDAPENTLANLRACLELRIGFEFDVRRSKDGVLVCVHDDTVDRTTNGHGRVADLTLAELRSLDAGGWFAPKYQGERIPTVDDVFSLLAGHADAPVLVAVDLKGDDDAIEADVVTLAQRHKVLDKLLFIGRAISVTEVRQRLRKASARSHIGCVANAPDEFAAALADGAADWVYVRYVPSEQEVAQAHRAGKRMFIAGPTVAGREEENWKAAGKRGVDAILTDYSLELSRSLR